MLGVKGDVALGTVGDELIGLRKSWFVIRVDGVF